MLFVYKVEVKETPNPLLQMNAMSNVDPLVVSLYFEP